MDYKNSKSRQQGFSYIGKYKVLQFLGKGGTAKVKLAEDTLTGKIIALKIFRDPSESKMKIKHSLQQVTQEFKVIENLKHINILNVNEILENTYYEKKNGQKYLTTTIVLEFAEGGECFDYVAQFQNFSEKVARTYFHQLLKGIQFLHENNICHRDIKMENLLFDEDFNLKIADFGFARDVEGQNGDGKLFSRLGTEGYQAAEIKEQKNYSGQKVDIFACGVVLFLFIAGRPPFEAAATNNRWYRTFQERKLDFWKFQNKYSNFPPQLCRLLDKMMHHYPERRATLDYIWANEWVNGPTLTQSELKKEMTEKWVQLRKKQDQERLKKKQQKQKMQEEVTQKKQKEQYQCNQDQILDNKKQNPLIDQQIHKNTIQQTAQNTQNQNTEAKRTRKSGCFGGYDEPPVEGRAGVVKIFRSVDLFQDEYEQAIKQPFAEFEKKWFDDQIEDIDCQIDQFAKNARPVQYLTKFNKKSIVLPLEFTLKALLPKIDKRMNCLDFKIDQQKSRVIVTLNGKNKKDDTEDLQIKFRKIINDDEDEETLLEFIWPSIHFKNALIEKDLFNYLQNITNSQQEETKDIIIKQ